LLRRPRPGATPADAKAAQQAIAQGRAIGTKTEREHGYIEAIAAYYDHFAERSHPVRLRSPADAFETLAKPFPDDDETQIFSALYLAATQPPTDKSFARAMRAAAILKPRLAEHPDHPGVAHYLIHSNDYPPVAAKGLEAAMCYADIARAAPHALHAFDYMVYADLQLARDQEARRIVDEIRRLIEPSRNAQAHSSLQNQ
jgi:hypothetical protein